MENRNLIKLVLARHGTTDWNLEKRYLGHSDIPLNAKGIEDARRLGHRLSSFSFDAVFSSDLSRARHTASIVTEGLCQPVYFSPRVDARLREMNFGHIEGLTYEQAVGSYPAEMKAWVDAMDGCSPPGSNETIHTVQLRMASFIDEIRFLSYQQVLVVAHGGTIRAWLAEQTGKAFWDIPIKHGEFIEWELRRGETA